MNRRLSLAFLRTKLTKKTPLSCLCWTFWEQWKPARWGSTGAKLGAQKSTACVSTCSRLSLVCPWYSPARIKMAKVLGWLARSYDCEAAARYTLSSAVIVASMTDINLTLKYTAAAVRPGDGNAPSLTCLYCKNSTLCSAMYSCFCSCRGAVKVQRKTSWRFSNAASTGSKQCHAAVSSAGEHKLVAAVNTQQQQQQYKWRR